MSNVYDSFKIRESYEADRLYRASRLLKVFEYFIFKFMGFDEVLLKKYVDSEGYSENSLSKLKAFDDFEEKDREKITKSINTINQILRKNGYAFEFLPYLEFNEEANLYPIPFEDVDKEYSFPERQIKQK